MRRTLLALTVFLILTPVSANAQTGVFYDTSQQLSSSFVKDVYQDRQGFIWVSTNNGLNMYDGYRFYVYNTSNGLNCDNVNIVLQGADNTLYIGTTTGLSIRHNDSFTTAIRSDTGQPFDGHVNDIATSPDGNVYVSTSGKGIWRVGKDKRLEPVIPEVNGTQFCQCILFDNNGTLWVVTSHNGIIAVTLKPDGLTSQKAKYYKTLNKSEHASHCMDEHGVIYVGYINGGVYRYDRHSDTFTLIPQTVSTGATSLLAKKGGTLLIGTNGNGVKSLNMNTGVISQAQMTSNQVNISRTKVYSIFEDKNQNLWLGLLQKGLFRQPHIQSPFGYIGRKKDNTIGDACVMGLYRQKDGTLWVMCDQDGLYTVDANGKQKRHYPHDATSATGMPGTVLDMTEDATGKLWVGTFTNGFGWIDPVTGAYHRSKFSYNKAQSVFDIKTDRKGRLWIGTLGDGVKCYDPQTGKLNEYYAANNYVVELGLSPNEDKLFVGTATGLCCYDINKNSWSNTFGKDIILEGQQINAICYRKEDGLWVGTSTGLYRIDRKKKKAVKYGEKEGFRSRPVVSIETDSQNRLWLGTNTGLCCYNPTTKELYEYFGSDGLQSNEFCEGASLCTDNGILYFAGVSGISYFNPSKIKANKQALTVSLSRLYIGGEAVTSGMESGSFVVCDTMATLASRYNFSHQDNTLTLNFSTLSYSRDEHVSYSYKINNEQWVNLPSGQNELRLVRLQPGNYKFQVVANDNGTRSSVKEFTIVIHNPWYLTPLARFFYALIVIGVVALILRNMRERNREHLRLQQHIHTEELNEQKLQFFINMSHEIRTPMTLIVSPLLQLIKEDTDTHRRATYEIIRRNAERIMHLVNQIMDIRKIDKGQMTMQMRETDAVAYTKDVVEMFRSQAEGKHIDLKFRCNPESLSVYLDRSAFDKVLMNLMSNAFKYARNGGRVEVGVERRENTMALTVFNTGDHIAETSINRIFERFYQAASSINQNKVGTGVGLDLTRSLVELHHGKIGVENVTDGVMFTVTIPLGREHLSNNEIADWDEEEDTAETLNSELNKAHGDVDTQDSETANDFIRTSPTKKITVVVVDDDDEIRNYLMAKLSTMYRTLAFADGQEALPAILREIPQLVITDVMMPGMDGITLCSKIKSNVNTNHIPIIMLTAKSRDEDEMQGLETGADLYITKPFNMDILTRQVYNLLSTRKLMENKFTGKEDMKGHVEEVEMESFDERLLARIMAVINANLSNSDLNIDMICSEVGISRVHLHRKMKELTNQTPHDFIRNLRLKQAARLLGRGGQSVTEVMYRCGFNSATSFSTMFKKMYGLSPRDYMKEHGE